MNTRDGIVALMHIAWAAILHSCIRVFLGPSVKSVACSSTLFIIDI